MSHDSKTASDPGRSDGGATLATGFRLVELGDGSTGGLDVAVTVDARVPLSAGLSLTLADTSGNAMLELAPGHAPQDLVVTVDGAPMLEVAHCMPLQRIDVGPRRFVLLPPYGVYNRRDDDGTRARRLACLLGPGAAADRGNVVAFRPSMAPAHRSAWSWSSRAGRMAGASGRGRRVAFMVLAVLGGLVVGMKLMRRPAGAPETADAVVPEVTARAPTAALATPPEAPRSADRAIAPAPQTSPPKSELTMLGSPASSGPAAGTTGVSRLAAAPTTPAPIAATPAGARPMRPARPAKRPARKPAKTVVSRTAAPALSADQEAIARSQIETLQLESGFDPLGAKAKLRRLKASLPKEARIQKEVDRALRTIAD